VLQLRRWPEDARKFASIGLGLAFCYFALGHFAITGELAQMLPPWVPGRAAIIYGTGALELFIALALFTRSRRRWGGLAAAAVLVLFFPANVYAAVNYIGSDAREIGPAYLWIRAPLQVFLLAWTLWPIRAGRDDPLLRQTI
jgi:uncharacterized membrane protein